MPYLVRRKSDGKLWRNRDFSNQYDWPTAWEKEWVKDPSLCKPFATVNAAKHSRGFRGYAWQIEFHRHRDFTVMAQRVEVTAEKLLEVVPVSVRVEVKDA